MEKEWVARAAEGGIDPEDLLSADPVRKDRGARTSPSWRGLVIAVVAAILLSVSATLLLSGSFGFSGRAAVGGCGPGTNCCPLPTDR